MRMAGATADVKAHPGRGPVLVSDFDGTMTRNDFYKLAVERLLPPDTPDHWAAYREGTLTHFEALRSYFAAIRVSEDEVMVVVNAMELDLELPAAVASCAAPGERGCGVGGVRLVHSQVVGRRRGGGRGPCQPGTVSRGNGSGDGDAHRLPVLVGDPGR